MKILVKKLQALAFCISITATLLHSEVKYDLVVCAVFQNEEFYLKEWLEFHKLVGVRHFYLYNNFSTDNYLGILRPYIEAGEVDLIEWPVKTYSEKDYLNNLQLPVYTHALNIAKQTSNWIAFIDLDEFLFPVIHTNLIDMLKEYEDFAGLAVNWQIYGTSWLDNIPKNKLIIESLIYKAKDGYCRNMFTKMVVQPKFVKAINNPHFFDYLDGYFAVDSSKKPITPGIAMHPIVIDMVRINHYWCGSLNLLINQKLVRRKLWGLVFPNDQLRDIIEMLNHVKDDTILRFLPQLKERILNKGNSQ